MSEPKERELEAILKLIELTQDGRLTWKATAPWGELVDTESRKIASVYTCDYEGRQLRIYIERVRVDKPSGLDALISTKPVDTIFGMPSVMFPYWDATTILEITDQKGRSLWRFPTKPALRELMAAVKYNVAGVKDLIDKLLEDKK